MAMAARTADLIAPSRDEPGGSAGHRSTIGRGADTLVEEAVAAAPGRPAPSCSPWCAGVVTQTLTGVADPVRACWRLRRGRRSATPTRRRSEGPAEPPVRAKGGAESGVGALLEGRRYIARFPSLPKRAGNAGHINFLPDFDGVYRRVPLVRARRPTLPAFSLSCARLSRRRAVTATSRRTRWNRSSEAGRCRSTAWGRCGSTSSARRTPSRTIRGRGARPDACRPSAARQDY
jgi:hypothetical protein